MTTKQTIPIRPFRQIPTMDDAYANTVWEHLHRAILDIFQQKPTHNLSYEELYRYAYTLVQNKKGMFLYENVYKTFQQQIAAAEMAILKQNNILSNVSVQWDHHKLASQRISDILMYMDRVYIPMHQKRGVYEMGKALFRDLIVMERIRGSLIDSLLNGIYLERNGVIVEKSVIKSVCQMMMELGADNREFYEKVFEIPLLQASQEFYRNEAAELMSCKNSVTYLREAEVHLREEKIRSDMYFSEETCAKVMSIAKNELLVVNMDALIDMENSGEMVCINEDRYEELARMYQLYQSVPNGLEKMCKVMLELVKSTGESIVTSSEYRSKDKTYIQTLLDLKDKYDRIIDKCFNNDRCFQHVLNQGFEYFFNKEERSAEYLSLFIDEKLRRGSREGSSEEELEIVLDKAMRLFRSLSAKDLFERCYKQHLTRRLLLNRSVSEDMERGMVVRLKAECGYQYTSKLEGMFLDMKTSSDMMVIFKEYLANQRKLLPIDLSVNVLTTGNWSIPSNSSKCVLPEMIEVCCRVFEDYYYLNHSGRVLNWLTHMGTADIRATFESKRHELNVSTMQMCILLLFNERSSWTCGDLKDRLKVTLGELQRHVTPLTYTKHPVLLRSGNGEEVVYEFNAKFRNKLFRVKIVSITQKEVKEEREYTNKAIEEHRTTLIEAAIVRVMKSRRTLQHNILVSEVIGQLSGRFNPTPQAIKRRIEVLIEREFLERSKNDTSVYNYLA